MKDSRYIVINGVVVGAVREGNLEVSLHWLKGAGFKGKVRVCSGMFATSPVFEVDLAPRGKIWVMS